MLSLVLMFVTLLTLRLDSFIFWPYWVVFFPLWILKSFMLIGFVFEIIALCRQPRFYVERRLFIKQTFLDAFFCADLLFFEVLACSYLERPQGSWMPVCVPLFILSILSFFICILASNNDIDCDFHLLVASNFLFFVFVALKLDGIVQWAWKVTFTPFFLAVCFYLVLELHEFFLSIALFVSSSTLRCHRVQSFSITTCYILALIPLGSFGLLLSFRLDGNLHLPYVLLATPLMTSILVFMGLCISLHPHLKWRKSMRSLTIHLNKCILPLQEYGNISYKLSSLHRRSQDSQERQPALGAPQYAHRGSSQNQSQLLSLRPPSPAAIASQRAQAAYAIEAIFHLTDPEELKKAEEEEDSASTPSPRCHVPASTSKNMRKPQANEEDRLPLRSGSTQLHSHRCVYTAENSRCPLTSRSRSGSSSSSSSISKINCTETARPHLSHLSSPKDSPLPCSFRLDLPD